MTDYEVIKMMYTLCQAFGLHHPQLLYQNSDTDQSCKHPPRSVYHFHYTQATNLKKRFTLV